jgi:hypothetical protein
VTWWVGLLAILAVLGTRLLVEIGAAAVDSAFVRVFGPGADRARLVTLCAFMAFLAGTLVWMATHSRGDRDVSGFLLICAAGPVLVAASQIYSYAGRMIVVLALTIPSGRSLRFITSPGSPPTLSAHRLRDFTHRGK